MASSLEFLSTPRLWLQPLKDDDAEAMTRLLQAPEIASSAAGIPYPFSIQDAYAWIKESSETARYGTGFTLGVFREPDAVFIGSVALSIWPQHRRGEIGYWFGKPYWGQGYATEAAARVLQAGFEDLGLNRIQANCYPRNAASARVMQKIGMAYEGSAREFLLNPLNGTYEDLDFYAVLAAEFVRSGGE
jgi:[ribosomal protein S5]-alanine N-acetyltransferase